MQTAIDKDESPEGSIPKKALGSQRALTVPAAPTATSTAEQPGCGIDAKEVMMRLIEVVDARI
jgi:hypothetical protein